MVGKLLIALSLYVGLGFFFGLNAIALLRGASVMTAMTRGLSALALFAALGLIASVASQVRPQPEAESPQEE